MPYPIADPRSNRARPSGAGAGPLFLDTETTGTGQNDVIIEVGIVDRRVTRSTII